MLFVFHVLVFLIHIYSDINCFVLKENQSDTKIDVQKFQISVISEDAAQQAPKVATTIHFFKVIQNLTNTKVSNLKSNVFDKMLSDEMLSIKRQFYEKDLTQSPVHIKGKGSVATPTLEIKQRWPATTCKVQEHGNVDNFNHAANYSTFIDEKIKANRESTEEIVCNNACKQKSKDKVLDLRSLPQNKVKPSHSRRNPVNSAFKMCTCLKTIPSTTCSHIGSTVTKSINPSHPANNQHQCTRTEKVSSINPAWYMSYPPYFAVGPTEMPYKISYYHPNILDDLKLPKKHKHKKTTRPYKESDLYYDKNWSIEEYAERDDYLENSESDSSSEENEIIIEESVDEIDTQDKFSGNIMKWDDGYIKVVEKDLVKDVVKSLKKHYSHIGIKDCYCSAVSVGFKFSYMCVIFMCCHAI